MKRISKDLVGASVSSVVLAVLKQEDSYGYEMIQKVKEITNGEVEWHEVGIYPVLSKMAKEGMIKSYWRLVDGQRPRKYYSILEPGLKQLDINKNELNKMVKLYNEILDLGKD